MIPNRKIQPFVNVTDNNGHKIANLWRRGKTYYGQLAVDDPNTGRRKTTKKSLVATNLSEAKKALTKLFSERDQGKTILPVKGPLFSDYLPIYLKYSEQEKSLKTFQNEKSFLEQFAVDFGTKRLGEISPQDILRYHQKRLDEGVSRQTAKLEVIALRNLYQRAIVERQIGSNPAKEIKLRDYLRDVLPKLGAWPINRVSQLTPTAWKAARKS